MRVVLMVVLGIVACGGARTADAPRADGVTRALEIARLEARREAGVAELVALARSGEAGVAERAMRGLGRAGDAAAVAFLGEVVAGQGARAVAAAEALGLSDRPAAEEPLLAAAGRAGEVRRAALWALGRVGTERAAAVLAGAALDASDPEAQRVAAVSLGVLGRREVKTGEAARAALLSLAAKAKDAALRRAAVYGLAFESPPDASPDVLAALVAGARDEDGEARAVALAGLGRRKPVPAVAITTLAAALDDGDFRAEAAAARGLVAAAREQPVARKQLLRWLGRRAASSVQAARVERVHPVLEALAGLDRPDDGTAAQVAGAWRARGPAAGEDRLAVARIDCLLAAAAARTPAWTAGPIDCVSGGLPAHETEVLLATVLGGGFGGAPADRMTALGALVTSPAPQVRAAAIDAAAKLASELQVAVEA
ncbi:MAG TPA: HEAT repeat domain-containing protein, partial [Kofleriaceae bacterium]|nr:HEAT repeat domain-containing protein [Kofleriaceae bacterium]